MRKNLAAFAAFVAVALIPAIYTNVSSTDDVTLEISLPEVFKKETATLRWDSEGTGATSCALTPGGPVGTSGEMQVGPFTDPVDTVYTFELVCYSGLTVVGTDSTSTVVVPKADFEENGTFDLRCAYSHTLPDDPIVFPGQPGASHLHDFLGFTETDAYSTPAQMRAALEEDPEKTTCTEQGPEGPPAANASGYWHPTLKVIDAFNVETTIHPSSLGNHIYYRGGADGVTNSFPPNFRMIAGNVADDEGEQGEILQWWCHSLMFSRVNSVPPDCGDANEIRVSISFPTCWNGDSGEADHRAHVVYKEDHSGSCPNSHPRKLPRIVPHISFQVAEQLGRFLDPETDTLKLGGPGGMTLDQYQWHLDYLFAWDPFRLDFLVHECTNSERDCKTNPPS